jgi:hypothetical protein
MILDDGIMARPGDSGERDHGRSRFFCVSADKHASCSWHKG